MRSWTSCGARASGTRACSCATMTSISSRATSSTSLRRCRPCAAWRGTSASSSTNPKKSQRKQANPARPCLTSLLTSSRTRCTHLKRTLCAQRAHLHSTPLLKLRQFLRLPSTQLQVTPSAAAATFTDFYRWLMINRWSVSPVNPFNKLDWHSRNGFGLSNKNKTLKVWWIYIYICICFILFFFLKEKHFV